jgi:hypothetical protein
MLQQTMRMREKQSPGTRRSERLVCTPALSSHGAPCRLPSQDAGQLHWKAKGNREKRHECSKNERNAKEVGGSPWGATVASSVKKAGATCK